MQVKTMAVAFSWLPFAIKMDLNFHNGKIRDKFVAFGN